MAVQVVEQEFYVCDPDKNTECRKGPGCRINGGPCRYTKNPKFSLVGTLPFKAKTVVKVP